MREQITWVENAGVSRMDSQPENKLRQRWIIYKFPDISHVNNSLALFAYALCLINVDLFLSSDLLFDMAVGDLKHIIHSICRLFSSLVTVVRNLFFSFTVCIFKRSCSTKQDILIIKSIRTYRRKNTSKMLEIQTNNVLPLVALHLAYVSLVRGYRPLFLQLSITCLLPHFLLLHFPLSHVWRTMAKNDNKINIEYN